PVGPVQRAAARGHDACERWVPLMIRRPVHAVAPAMFAARGQRRARAPAGDDVVRVLAVGRDLDQVDLALAPGIQRLDPAAGTPLVGGLQVLVVGERALALHQPEAARVAVLETAVLDRA